jgi:hypothetical protein
MERYSKLPFVKRLTCDNSHCLWLEQFQIAESGRLIKRAVS